MTQKCYPTWGTRWCINCYRFIKRRDQNCRWQCKRVADQNEARAMNTHELGKLIARGIFKAPYYANDDKVQRIAFKGGKYPDRETDLGGLSESSLAATIEGLLNEHLPEPTEAKP